MSSVQLRMKEPCPRFDEASKNRAKSISGLEFPLRLTTIECKSWCRTVGEIRPWHCLRLWSVVVISIAGFWVRLLILWVLGAFRNQIHVLGVDWRSWGGLTCYPTGVEIEWWVIGEFLLGSCLTLNTQWI